MQCRDVQSLLSAERDRTLSAAEQARLTEHLDACADCRAVRTDVAAAAAAWRERTARVPVPAVEREWREIRQRIRGERPAGRPAPASRPRFVWVGIPLATAAVLVFIGLVGALRFGMFSPEPAAAVARIESVEIDGGSASTVVYVDPEAGWVVVWSDESAPAGGT